MSTVVTQTADKPAAATVAAPDQRDFTRALAQLFRSLDPEDRRLAAALMQGTDESEICAELRMDPKLLEQSVLRLRDKIHHIMENKTEVFSDRVMRLISMLFLYRKDT